MLRAIVLSAIISNVYTDSPQNVTKRNFIYDTYLYDHMYTLSVNDSTEQILDFTEESDLWRGHPTRIHVSCNDSISADHPVFITATQQKGISSWELPLVVQTKQATTQFNDMARTLCPHDSGPNVTTINRPLIQISSSNPTNVSVNIKVKRVQDFYVEVNKEIHMNVTPSSPKYYFFSFDSDPWNVSNDDTVNHFFPRFNYTVPKSVILVVDSDDSLCATVSIQNNSCPVFDNEENMLYQGYHLTMTTKGGITLTQEMFPLGFYVVFIVKQTDGECTGVSRTALGEWRETEMEDEREELPGRVKSFRFRIIATISYKEYLVGALVTLALVTTIALFAFVALLPCPRQTEMVLIVDQNPGPSTSHAEDVREDTPIRPLRDSLSSDSDDEVYSELPRPLTLAGLSRARPKAQYRRSDRYIWSALTVAVVYALPVVQLLSTYQRMVLQTGDQDLCYYNFLCAHPLWSLSDFGHVYSNIGYVVLGVVFMIQINLRRRKERGRSQDMGIGLHSGLFNSMGVALAMEGILSACYHLCPNKMNFQFDSSFMYVIAVLVMVKLYQNRHPDVNAAAHATFMLIAFIMALGLFGIMYPSVYFWVIFTILHLGACFVLTLKIYYLGRLKIGPSMVVLAYKGILQHKRAAFRPNYTARAILLAIANIANWSLAAYGLYEHNKDLARHLLAILMGNAILYLMFYMIMKLLHKEKIMLHTWLYFILAHLAWFGAMTLFLNSKTKWSQTPAQSRQHNAVCSALDFYDSHDLWHLASAAALFLSFNVLLTVDDALKDTPQCDIHVF